MALDEQELYRKLLNQIDDGIYFVDRERTISYWNHTAERITGYTAEEVVGSKCCDNILNHIDKKGVHLCHMGCPLLKTIQDGQDRQAPVFLRHKSGHRVPVSIKCMPIYDEGVVVGAIEIFTDREESFNLLESMEELKVLAQIDPLTGLANRRKMDDFLAQHQANQNEIDLQFGVMMADIDFFKNVNDTYGHDAGDEVLKMTSKVLASIGRKSDLVGRWGGEEFTGVFPGISKEFLKSTAEKMRMLIAESAIYYKEEKITISISIGATMSRKGETPTELMCRVDELLYTSKSSGRNCVSMDD
jgi:diguanylate cyclase (GGDEF)-like protein/PAS domain S-box-containing protein